ncbi:keratin-associated 10-like protein, partial [Cryptosporidium bovis]|uniref:keratin-associated 10-like protein n=1 Tax=Cryptosporidium bovis TaxID=310047 RepID=UPI00351A0C10
VEPSRGRYREIESSGDEYTKVEPSREGYRETESSRDESMKVEPSRERYRETELSRDESMKVEPSRDEYTKVEPSRDEYTKVEPSRDEYTKVEPSRDEYTKVEPSRDESRKVKPFKKRYKEGYRAMELSGERYKSRLKSIQNRKKSELESKLIPTIKRPELEISEGRLESISKSALNIKHQQYESYINNIAINNTCYYQEDKNIDKEIINSIIKLKEPQIFTMGMQNIENKVLFWKNGDNKKLTREVNDEIVDLFIGKSSLTKSIGIISDNENSEN